MTNFEEVDKSKSLPVESIWELDKYFHDLKTNSILINNFYDHKPDSKFPAFSDLSYRKRRHEIIQNAFKHKHGEPIPRIEYTQDELSTWNRVYTSLSGLIKRYACKEHLRSIGLFEKEGIYSPDWIPQLEDVSRFLQKKVGFQLRPVAGQISSRDFLEIISFRMFPCTQYLRHPLCVDHSPEPDIVHELLGHLPLMLSPGFADFFHQIGLLSLGLSDHDLNRLFTLFWWTIEWGMCREGDSIKAWGAAILSSPGEIKHAFSGAADFRELKWLRNDEDIIAFSFEDAQFQDEDFQSVYYVANSLIQGEKHLIDFIKQLKRPFKYRYEPITQSLERIDNNEIRRKIWREIVDNLDLLFELR